MSTPLLIGIDAGTSALKCVAFNLEGHVVASTSRKTGFFIPGPGMAEYSMEELKEQVFEALRELTFSIHPETIQGVGISATMGGLWLLDQENKPLGNAVLWNDGRTGSILSRWKQEGLMEEIFTLSGNVVVPGFTVPQLCWLKEHKPAVLDRAACQLFSKDWIRCCLTGELCTEESDASHVPGDVQNRSFSSRIFELCGIPELTRLLLPVKKSTDLCGEVTASASETTGLPVRTPVSGGLADVSASLTGLGASHTGTATAIMGTSALFSVTTDTPVLKPSGVGLSFLIPENKWTRTFPNQTGTLALDWFIREFYQDPAGVDLIQLGHIAEKTTPGAHGVIFHPYLNNTGMMAPFYEPRGRARFWNIGIHNTKEDMLRSLYEGLGYAMYDCMEYLPAFQGAVRMSGGVSKSPFWRQLIADITGYSLALMGNPEPGALGAALTAGVGCGIWHTIEEASESCCRVAGIIEPDQNMHDFYRPLREQYQYLRKNIREEYDFFEKRKAKVV